jgi:hypothetical protein
MFTQDHIQQFISYIHHDNVAILEASEKGNVPYHTGNRRCMQYLKKDKKPLQKITLAQKLN